LSAYKRDSSPKKENSVIHSPQFGAQSDLSRKHSLALDSIWISDYVRINYVKLRVAIV